MITTQQSDSSWFAWIVIMAENHHHHHHGFFTFAAIFSSGHVASRTKFTYWSVILNCAWGIVSTSEIGTWVFTFVVNTSLIWGTSGVFETNEDAGVALIVVAEAVGFVTDDLTCLSRITFSAGTRTLASSTEASKICCTFIVAPTFKWFGSGTSELGSIIHDEAILANANSLVASDLAPVVVSARDTAAIFAGVPCARIFASSDSIIASQVGMTVLIRKTAGGKVWMHWTRNGITTVFIPYTHLKGVSNVTLCTGTLWLVINYTAHSILATDISKTTRIYALSSNASLIKWTALIR